MNSLQEKTASFKTDNELVNKLYSNIVWGQKGNFQAVPTDCPQRDERLGWTGDAQIFTRTATYNRNVQPFFNRWLYTLRDDQSEIGGFPRFAPLAPTMVNGYYNNAGCGWGDVGIITPWEIYLQYGDTEILQKSYGSMCRYMDYLESQANDFIQPIGGYGDWVALLGTPSDIMLDAIAYLKIILIGVIFIAFYNMSANILRAVGDSKGPLYCLFASIIINLVLDLVFIRVFQWGIEGAAYATIISQLICALLCTVLLFVKTKEIIPTRAEFDLKINEYKKLLTFGFAMGLMACIINVGSVILQTGINGLGTTVVVAHTAARRVLDIIMVMVYTTGFAMTTYASQNYGAGKIDRIKQGIIHAVIIDTVISTIILVWTFIFGADVVAWVASSQNPEILHNGELYLKISVVFFYVLGPLFIFRCSLQGMGEKSTPLITSGMELVVKILSVIFLVPRLGYTGVALTEPISWFVMTIVLFIGVVLAFKKCETEGRSLRQKNRPQRR